MANGVQAPKPTPGETEQMASERAGDRVRAGRWDLTVAVFAYATLGAVILLRLEGLAIEFVAIIAILGLALVWFAGWRRGRQLFRRFYNEELRQLQAFSSARKAEVSVPSIITPRETEILAYIARGYMNKQVAHELGLSEHTIKNHLSSIMHKLDVNDRTQAVVLAINNGWIASPEIEPAKSTTSDKV